MFTKEDYINYFEEIARTERNMTYNMEDCLFFITDKHIKNVLVSIAKDEVAHYSYVRHILDNLLLEHFTDKRQYMRKHWQGRVKIKGSSKTMTIGWCVNVSEGGICIESKEKISVGDKVKIEARFFYRPEEIKRDATVRWSKKITDNSYIAGLEFTVSL